MTVKTARLEADPKVAPTLVDPTPEVTASPVLPTIAAAGLDDDHCATEDTSCCVESLAAAEGVSLASLPLDAQDAYWNRAKAEEKA